MVATVGLKEFDPEIASLIESETRRQEFGLEMIPSENFTYGKRNRVPTPVSYVINNNFGEEAARS